MADQDYLVGRAPPPSPWVGVLHRRVIPAAIDAAGSMELALSQLAIAARRRPLPGLMLAVCAGWGLARALRRTPFGSRGAVGGSRR